MDNELKFSDFLNSGHKYDHDKEDVWEALGASEADAELIRVTMTKIFEDKEDKLKSLSQRIEKCLEIDMPAPWKALGFLKIGQGAFKGRLLQLVASAPDEIPTPVLKQLLITAIMVGGGI
jgi:hypothetical protein